MKTKEKRKVKEPSYLLKDLDKAAETALFYGFTPIKSPKIESSDLSAAKSFKDGTDEEHFAEIFPRPEEKISFFRSYMNWGLHETPHPLMVYFRRPFSGNSIRKHPNEHHCGLEIVGSVSSICEAITIKAACAILADYGENDVTVDINSMGDKDSIARFERDLVGYVRRHGESLPTELRQSFRKNPFEMVTSKHEKWLEFKENAPQSMSSLSEPAIDHFKEVLEYLEALDVPYRINHNLLGNKNYCSHTIFEIRRNVPMVAPAENLEKLEEIENTLFAVGTRHNHFTKKLGFKKDLPVMSVNLGFKKKTEPKLFFRSKPKPKFYFIQFGGAAKQKSLHVIETLRKAKIPVYHSLTRDKFVGQLTNAEDVKTPYVVIMGQKEALENSVVVRHMSTRVQETIPLLELAHYLAKLK